MQSKYLIHGVVVVVIIAAVAYFAAHHSFSTPIAEIKTTPKGKMATQQASNQPRRLELILVQWLVLT